MYTKVEYHPLMASDPSDSSENVSPLAKPAWSSRLSRTVLVIVCAMESLALVATILIFVHRTPTTADQCTLHSNPPSYEVLYSPAQEAVEYEVRVFSGASSPFHLPPSPELDEMWHNLYKGGITRITKDDAARLPNKTEAIPGDDGHYIAELGMFHTLHCLNKIRMALDPDYYPDWRISTSKNWIPSQKYATEHLWHCLDYVRQAIMCSGDTNMIVWQWEDASNTTVHKANVAHTCRKFDKLQAWAKEHEMVVELDPKVHIEDDIVIPIIPRRE
ncbi:hypothetical protein MSAN_01825800 [Mycena sanguinolenta]|uniref:Tat pathway signal sequence n=1 Tax=Mycena sanguinolenta TaxID=230812 RepID=A0A8H6XUX0_9AGAR|nr:hypothetical protein MSAN_01825800 [Mycena sanguinolenta]